MTASIANGAVSVSAQTEIATASASEAGLNFYLVMSHYHPIYYAISSRFCQIIY
jgi:hypothetical protein